MAKLLIDREEAIKTAVEHYRGVTQFDAMDLVEAMEAIPTTDLTAYHCELEYDNGAVVKKVEMIVFTNDHRKALKICDEILCKHSDECIRSSNITRTEIGRDSAFIIGGI